jgi:hypothetical protein
MNSISWDSVIWYLVFSIFAFHQKLHFRNFRGSSRVVENLLGVSVLLGSVVGTAYLAYYGWKISWLSAGIILAMSIAAVLVTSLLEKIVPSFVISIVGVIGWPICAYLMFSNLRA